MWNCWPMWTRATANLSGPATKRILEREHSEYGQAVYVRLAGISVAQIYRFRSSEAYRKKNTAYQPTRPSTIPIGASPGPRAVQVICESTRCIRATRMAPKAFITINAVDEVTHSEIVAVAPQISERWLMPLLEQFPFTIRGFHSDNGSEFINYAVARMLEKLLIEQTKSRAHRMGDNGLVNRRTERSSSNTWVSDIIGAPRRDCDAAGEKATARRHCQTRRVIAPRTKTPERRGNNGRMEKEENQKQVSLPFHRPSKSLHSHRADGCSLCLKIKNRKEPLATDLSSSLSGSFFG
jgi:transposase InsO family protein